jgi:hypothetical protein
MPEETNLVYKASSTTKLAKQTNIVEVLLLDWFFKVDIEVKQLCIGTKVAQAMRDWALEDSRRSICNHRNVLGGTNLNQNVVTNHKRKGFTNRASKCAMGIRSSLDSVVTESFGVTVADYEP